MGQAGFELLTVGAMGWIGIWHLFGEDSPKLNKWVNSSVLAGLGAPPCKLADAVNVKLRRKRKILMRVALKYCDVL